MGSGRHVIIEPQLPYMYIPERDYGTFVDTFTTIFGDRKVTCDKKKGFCKWNKSCDAV